jgi:hypothetical protein
VSTCTCGRELTETEAQSCADADSDLICDECLNAWADETLPRYAKVMLPLKQGDTSVLVERVWCQLLTGDTDAGTGIIKNKPVVCSWVKYGDRVTFEDIYPDRAPYAPIVTAVVEKGA